MTDAVKLLDVLESQALSLAAQAAALAGMAKLMKQSLGVVQGTAGETEEDDMLERVVLPRTFGDGKRRK